MGRPARASEAGLAMIAVLLVLMALFVLSAPFLVTVRNADQASSESADRAVLRITLDSAGRHAAAHLAASHPALDETPYFDDEAELTVTARFPEGFLATDDPHQVMWGLEARDVAGRIDLASASPHVLANVIGGAARLTGRCGDKDLALEVSGTQGFLAEGVVRVDDEWMAFGELEPTKLLRLQRGLLVVLDADGEPAECGPRPPQAHEIGAFVLDQRAYALCEWRTAADLPEGRLRRYESLEEVRAAERFMLGPGLGRDAYLALARTTTAFGRERAGAVWQRPARVIGEPQGEPQYGCRLTVDDLRWFNPGTTVWITDGTNEEYGLVRGTEGNVLVLDSPLRSPYAAYRTLVHALARAPVNVNTASPEVLRILWTNLKLRGRSARLTEGEAEQLVDLALVSRPFTGFEDLLRRLVLPAAGLEELPPDAPVRPEELEKLAREALVDAQGKKILTGFIDPDDARAFYKNARNANDNELEFATMPLCFTSRDVYELELRAAVNAPSGADRARGARERVEMIVPQRDLFSVWTRQEDFDEAPRLDQAAAGWLTGPVPVARHDPLFGAVSSLRWPARARAHLGPHDTLAPPTGEDQPPLPYTFASREDEDGWAQLAATREDARARGASYALHFDHETETLEGRFLPDEPEPLDLAKLGWSGAADRMSGMAASLWIQPRALEEGARLLDVGGQLTDTDRLSLLFEEGHLVLRVLDGAGDHPDTEFRERAEVRFPLTGEGPGLPLETWSHVQIAVDGNRPDQMALWVDGRRSAHTPGLTRLTAALPSAGDRIQVESTEGFPDKCVLRIGNELIEALKQGEGSFLARFLGTGENAGFGGRLAREIHLGYPETNQGLFKFTDHPAGTTVQLYGYSVPLFSNLPSVATNLRDELNLFAVARVEGLVVSGDEKRETAMDPITLAGDPVAYCYGVAGRRELEGLLLAPVDPGRSLEDTMAAFSPRGGYAAIIGRVYAGGGGTQGDYLRDADGYRVNGVEVVRYTGWDGQTLHIDRREGAGLARLQGNIRDEVEGRGSFIVYYELPAGWTGTFTPPLEERNNRFTYQVMVIPISIPAAGASGVAGFDPGNNGSGFVQLTYSGGQSAQTEWVRYDEIASDGSFVRDRPDGLMKAYEALFGDPGDGGDPGDPQRPGGSGGAGGMPLLSAPEPARTFRRAGAPAAAGARQSSRGGSYWDYTLGQAEDQDFAVSRAVNSQLQFRGVLGTFQHAHASGVMVLPVFRVREGDETGGWPGRFDSVMFMTEDLDLPGFPGVVQHANRPYEYLAYGWREGGDALTAEALPEPVTRDYDGMVLNQTYVALDDRVAIPFAPSPTTDADGNPLDSRLLTRMVLYPSGELPRQVERGQLGGEAVVKGGAATRTSSTVPSVVVDEALFFPSELGNLSGMPVQMIVAQPFSESDDSFTALKETLRTPLGDTPQDKPLEPGATAKPNQPDVMGAVIANLPEVGGVLRIGDEILCYERFETSGNAYTFTVAPAGRGLLGSEPQPHRPTEAISFLGAFPAGILAGNVGADDAQLLLVELPPDFPPMGLVHIEDELVHYTRIEGNALAMPRASREPGARDEKGPGLFRGRFGTARAPHPAGSAVILFPFRYWDGWSDLADAPELTYYQLALDQPDAYWRRVFWKASTPAHPGTQLAVLQRTDAALPWDAVPEGTNGLTLLLEGKLEAEGNPIGVQADRVEWRVFVRHLPGSFDPEAGLSHGWKTTPRLELFGVEYLGPGRTFARIDR